MERPVATVGLQDRKPCRLRHQGLELDIGALCDAVEGVGEGGADALLADQPVGDQVRPGDVEGHQPLLLGERDAEGVEKRMKCRGVGHESGSLFYIGLSIDVLPCRCCGNMADAKADPVVVAMCDFYF
ncbi:hypothetical protein [Kushneria aurantia]|uniref:Uncharacterized protein n=1 Tax=Kushneria aurantia TaxID=504092 RepID=A0ABV6G6H2_9GAMM|nr:hypothetical protein [Kushneria aurantia]